MTIRHAYQGAARGWSEGAEKVYAPLARELVACARPALAGTRVLDVGAGTGVGSRALREIGAEPVGIDLSHDMLAHDRNARPPAAVGDVSRLPLRADAVDHVLAPFVLNHLEAPVPALVELGRVTRRGGEILATVFSNASTHPAKDRVDEVAESFGWQPPDWYVTLKERAVPLLGSTPAMEQAARDAGLVDVAVAERAVDVDVRTAEDLVAYRLGQAHSAAFLATLSSDDEARLRTDAVAAAREVMTPYHPLVVFLAARVA